MKILHFDQLASLARYAEGIYGNHAYHRRAYGIRHNSCSGCCYKLAPLSLTLVGHTLDGDPALFGSGTRVMFYHLKVVNQRRWISAQNCRVMLVGLSRRDPGNIFQPIPMSVPQQFVWAPAEFMPPIITVQREQVLDFGCIEEHGTRFIPRLYVIPFNFQGYVGAHEAVRYQLQIEATNFVSPIYVVEVSWDGVWDFVPATMRQHLPIRIIPSPS